MLSLPARTIAITVALQAAWVLTSATACKAEEARQFPAEPTRTGKERLGGKASDEQRVDNCKVPLDLRGPKPRPAECGDSATTEAKH